MSIKYINGDVNCNGKIFTKNLEVEDKLIGDFDIDFKGGLTTDKVETKELNVSGEVETKTLSVSSDATIGGTLTTSGDIHTDGDLQVNGSISANGGSEIYVSIDKGSTYTGPITTSQWETNIKNGAYSVGTIFKITKVFNGKEMRFIAIGLNHDVLSNTDLGELEPNGETAKMTLQCYDMPFGKVNLGLPFENAKNGNLRVNEGSDVAITSCRSFSVNAAYPSNTHGYATAVGLRQMEQAFYDGLAPWLQALIKVVRKDIFISEEDDGGTHEMFDSTSTAIVFEGNRHGSQVNCKVFSLSATEVGIIPNPSNNGKDIFAYTCPYNNNNIRLEGKKYDYFNTTYIYTSEPSTDLRRPRYWKGSLWIYCLRSPSLASSEGWARVHNDGRISDGSTNGNYGVAPAFCI